MKIVPNVRTFAKSSNPIYKEILDMLHKECRDAVIRRRTKISKNKKLGKYRFTYLTIYPLFQSDILWVDNCVDKINNLKHNKYNISAKIPYRNNKSIYLNLLISENKA